jgi:hypothetical protein
MPAGARYLRSEPRLVLGVIVEGVPVGELVEAAREAAVERLTRWSI